MTADLNRQELNTVIRDCHNALEAGIDEPKAYFNRGVAWLCKSEWGKARADLATADELGFDVAATFVDNHKSAGAFEDAMGIELPTDIADILDPISEEEDTAFAKAIMEERGSGFVSERRVMEILWGGLGAGFLHRRDFYRSFPHAVGFEWAL